MSTYVLRTFGIADALVLQVSQKVLEALKGTDASMFFFVSLETKRIENLGAERVYESTFQSLLNHRELIVLSVRIMKDYVITQGPTGELDTLRETSNWKILLIEIIDEKHQWKYRMSGQVEWNEGIPTFQLGCLFNKVPTDSWLEAEAGKKDKWWKYNEGRKTSVFCPDVSYQVNRILHFGNEVLAKTFIELTDPDHKLGRALSYPDVCTHCGSEHDGFGECGNECSVYEQN